MAIFRLRRRSAPPCQPLACFALLLTACSGTGFSQGALHEPEDRVIRYNQADGLADPVSLLQGKLASAALTLKFESGHGYLASLLALLKIPISSQGLVFSKTSLQPERVSPQTPRAVYFNDEVYVSWVPAGEAIDVLAVDPAKGPIFYTLDQRQTASPRFARSDACMSCHLGFKTQGVPGLFMRSVVTTASGSPTSPVDGFVIGHGSPLRDRWGGWYVTGDAGDVHSGKSTEGFDASRYLSKHSDIVALMVLAHQVKMQNLITRANYETRFAMDSQMSAQNPAWAKRRIANAAEPLLEYMLFRDEAVFKGPMQGASGFADDFERPGPRDSQGRSLRQLDLKTRLMRYPCSYLIYAPAFDALPIPMKSYLWQRLSEILSGKDRSQPYATMPLEDRQAVFEILRETKPEFAAWLRR